MTGLTYPERVETIYLLAMTMIELDVPPVDVARYLDNATFNARWEHQREAVAS